MSMRGKWRVVVTPDYDSAGPGSYIYILFVENGGKKSATSSTAC